MSYTSESFTSASSGPITVTPLSPRHQTDSDSVPLVVHVLSDSEASSLPTETVPKRKRGRPRKDEIARGKAPMVADAPKRKRGRPRKYPVEVTGASTSSSLPVHSVTYPEFHAAQWEQARRFMLQGERISKLESELVKTKEIVSYLQELYGFKPSAPPS